MPLMVWTARKIESTAPAASGRFAPRSSSSSAWLTAVMCSRLSVRKSCAYSLVSTMGLARRSREHALHGLEHATGLERLHHEVLGASLDRLDDQRLLPHRAAHEDSRFRVERADLPDGIDAAHVRHHDVHRDEIGPQF